MSKEDRSVTTDRLRHDIDRGRAGDKIGFPDPAAAPLGTDDEAAGTTPRPSQVAHAYEHEVRRRPDAEDATDSGPVRPGEAEGKPDARVWFLVAGAALVAGVVLAAVA